jgi:Fic family protein
MVLYHFKVKAVMREFVEWLAHHPQIHPIQFAAEVYFKFVAFHTFSDGNRRTGRVLINLLLPKGGYSMSMVTLKFY